MMSKIFYDIIPPKQGKRKITRKRKSCVFRPGFDFIKTSVVKIVALFVIVSLNWTGLSAVIETFAYFNDTETSIGNTFQAGILNFELSYLADFSPSSIEIGKSATRTISIINYGNEHRYNVTATNFSAEVCDYLFLEANLDGGDVEYFGKLINFVDFGPQVFAEPEDWVFTLTLPSGTPESVQGQTCRFDFVFFGSQTKNNLPFGKGFSDIKKIPNSIATAICRDVEIHSKGYWKNRSDVYKPYLPQYLGCNTTSSECVAGYEEVGNQAKVFQILQTDYSLSMRNKLRGQLLAMKFNIAHFGIGGYIDASTTPKTLDDIVADADNLLRDPNPVLEEMKNLLDYLNNLGQIRYCATQLPQITVLVPNGGEQWWVGHYYDIEWTTSNLNCPNDASEVSIWYSRDSGATFANIATSTENDGVYNWRAPLSINGYYVPSSNARIKIVARCSENQMVVGWDMSDADFCPPIDYSLLTPEELELIRELGLMEDVIQKEIISEEETPVIEEPAEEAPVIEDVPIIEGAIADEEPAIVPDDSSSPPDGTEESGGDGGSGDGDGDTSGSSDTGESSGEGRDAGDSVSE